MWNFPLVIHGFHQEKSGGFFCILSITLNLYSSAHFATILGAIPSQRLMLIKRTYILLYNTIDNYKLSYFDRFLLWQFRRNESSFKILALDQVVVFGTIFSYFRQKWRCVGMYGGHDLCEVFGNSGRYNYRDVISKQFYKKFSM